MNMLILILFLILFIGYACLEGIKEAYLYNYRDGKDLKYSKDLHPLYVSQRIIVSIGFGVGLFFLMSWFSFLALIGFAIIFPLFHDGFYYVTRNDIDSSVYPKRFRSNHNESNARISIQRFGIRLALAIIGIVCYLMLFIVI